jgi:two-component sensor histidine kinase
MQLEPEADSVPVARATTRTFFSDCTGPDRVASLELIVSELVSNSLRHARQGTVGLRLTAGDELTVEVIDGSRGETVPRVKHPAKGEIGGLGLQVVAALSEAWGSEVRGAGRIVWASLPA